MKLNKCTIGDCVEPYSECCGISNLTEWEVSGVNRDKEFFEPSKQIGVDTSDYKIVPPNYFACNLMHVGRDKLLPIAMNHSKENKFVSPAYTVFKLKDESSVLREYFFIMLKSNEKDRYFWFHADGSIRDGMSWEDFCGIEIELPSTTVQQKYVDVYNAMLANQQSYERGLDDFKLTCDLYIENLRKKTKCEKIGPFIEEKFEKNENNKIKLFQGVTVDHVFTNPKRVADDSESGNIVRTGQFAFNKVMKSNGTKMPIALREGPDCVVSNSYQVFEVINKEKLLSEYLMLWLNRTETQRYCGFISFGTTRDIFTFDDMKQIKIPIPSIQIQKDIVDIYNVYNERKAINEKLKKQIKDLCPILIKGSLKEAYDV